MNVLHQAWETYWRRVLRPIRAPAEQVIETRRAYFYGVKTVLDIMNQLKDQPEFVRNRELEAMIMEHKVFMLSHDRLDVPIV